MDHPLININLKLGIFISAAEKSIQKLVELQGLAVKHGKV